LKDAKFEVLTVVLLGIQSGIRDTVLRGERFVIYWGTVVPPSWFQQFKKSI